MKNKTSDKSVKRQTAASGDTTKSQRKAVISSDERKKPEKKQNVAVEHFRSSSCFCKYIIFSRNIFSTDEDVLFSCRGLTRCDLFKDLNSRIIASSIRMSYVVFSKLIHTKRVRVTVQLASLTVFETSRNHSYTNTLRIQCLCLRPAYNAHRRDIHRKCQVYTRTFVVWIFLELVHRGMRKYCDGSRE